MNCDRDLEKNNRPNELEAINADVWALAKRYEREPLVLLSLLQNLERLHREISEQVFKPCLPDTRHELYRLLKEIEETGGWPYIERMRLQDCLANLKLNSATSSESNEI